MILPSLGGELGLGFWMREGEGLMLWAGRVTVKVNVQIDIRKIE